MRGEKSVDSDADTQWSILVSDKQGDRKNRRNDNVREINPDNRKLIWLGRWESKRPTAFVLDNETVNAANGDRVSLRFTLR
jgi:hypothetical protein